MRTLTVLALTAALGAGLAACQPAAETTTEADAAADAATPADAEAVAAGTEGAEDFVRALYADVADPAFASLSGDDAPGVYSASAWAAIQAANERRGSEMGPLDADPLCRCQDPTGMTLQAVTVTQTDVDRADAAVELMQDGAQTSTTLNLLRENGEWRVDNVTPEGDPTMRDELQG